ncbi:BZ3500_MvSof-1268-A1-R1_Chr4-1g06812 [Microbotryum saponariae]|uniref:BZ3500_MvSof-1268-A1-R1_Chr4-1g06812 protein n=1 Tax=Microbotryum saponariae TaxID=289078 RepID=A0A2X0KS48_9BASI|nr:BZ3500_MvSof-1268-A1-R1_Chr4-1g06812 [Microbotryum saponariae]SDA06469.1 BZ3501_MvSof-1269-A2-R1_Chr4-1g06514 [Microbotryum saponariae]
MAMPLSHLVNGVLYRKKSVAPAEARALQPICAALEVHNWKTAQLAVAKQLKKLPHHYLAHALNCLALSGPRPMSDSARKEIQSTIEYIKTHTNGAGLGDPETLLVLACTIAAVNDDKDAAHEEVDALMSLAVERHPNKEDVNIEAFQAFVRSGNYKSAQQTSIRLHKNNPNQTHYLWWSVAAILLRVRSSPTTAGADVDKTNEVLLTLAERQLATHFKPTSEGATSDQDQKYESDHEFYLVTRFLELCAVHWPSDSTSASVFPSIPRSTGELTPTARLLRHLASPEADSYCATGLGLKIWRREVELKHGSRASGEWKAGWERMKKGIEEGSVLFRRKQILGRTSSHFDWPRFHRDTNWHTLLYLIRSAFAMADDSSLAFAGSSDSSDFTPRSSPTAEGQQLVAETRKLLEQFSEGLHASSAPHERGYLLGLLEIARENRRREWDEGSERLGKLVTRYFERFEGKMCCFDDLRAYLEVLDEEESRQAREKLEERGNSAGDLTEKQAYSLINAAKIARFLAPSSTSAEAQVILAHSYLTRYFQVLPLGFHLDSTDLQPADDFALLAAQAFVSAYHLDRDRSRLESALLVLDYALQRSRHKYQIRLLAINIQRQLGASSIAMDLNRSLGIKSIQFDTLIHVAATRGSTFANAAGATTSANDAGILDELRKANKWYGAGLDEAADMVVRVFMLHNFSKIEDFFEFQTRLSNSYTRDLVIIESLRIQLLRGAVINPSLGFTTDPLKAILQSCDADRYSDNRDFDTIPNLQRKDEASIWDQTGLGPRPGREWLTAIAQAYQRFLDPLAVVDGEDEQAFDSTEVSGSAPDIGQFVADHYRFLQLLPSEKAMVDFSRLAGKVFVAALDDPKPEQLAHSFFSDQLASLTSAIEDSARLPWEVLSIAANAFELALTDRTAQAYCLLDLALGIVTEHLTSTKATDHAKHVKRLRNFRTKSREATQKIGKEVTNWAKKVGKERNKVIGNVVTLKQFEKFDDDTVLDWAHALVESRKNSAETLGAAIHRRCIK